MLASYLVSVGSATVALASNSDQPVHADHSVGLVSVHPVGPEPPSERGGGVSGSASPSYNSLCSLSHAAHAQAPGSVNSNNSSPSNLSKLRLLCRVALKSRLLRRSPKFFPPAIAAVSLTCTCCSLFNLADNHTDVERVRRSLNRILSFLSSHCRILR